MQYYDSCKPGTSRAWTIFPLSFRRRTFLFWPDRETPKGFSAVRRLWREKSSLTAAVWRDFSLYGISGYRSYERQSSLYLKKGNPADLYLAPPGCSEHQTGLALDVPARQQIFELEEKFSSTPEGIFLEKHAPFYGFILRYPKGKEKVTGYAWEPWHLRYVGRSLALCLSFMRLTLEEYLALSLSEE